MIMALLCYRRYRKVVIVPDIEDMRGRPECDGRGCFGKRWSVWWKHSGGNGGCEFMTKRPLLISGSPPTAMFKKMRSEEFLIRLNDPGWLAYSMP
jgi:hypothetical protein